MKRASTACAAAALVIGSALLAAQTPTQGRGNAQERPTFEIFKVDDCISAEMRAHFRGVFVDALAQSTSTNDGDRKQAIETCVSGAETMRGIGKLCESHGDRTKP